MKKLFTFNAIIFSLLIALCFNASAQVTATAKSDSLATAKVDTSKTDTSKNGVRASAVYIELGGPGLAISANYDQRFTPKRNGFGYRIGAGYFASGGNNVFTVPIQINYLAGKPKGNHFLELGAGTTFLNSNGDNKGSTYIFDKVTGFIYTVTIGYRYQPVGQEFNFRIGFVPIISGDGIIPAGGVSFGITLK